METRSVLRVIGLFILMVFMILLMACTKPADKNLNEEKKGQPERSEEAASIDEKDFNESNEDLMTVDYREFYDQLSPYGEWVEVRPEEIGLYPHNDQSSGSNEKSSTSSNPAGVKNVSASDVDNTRMVYVWRPSTDLVVMRVAGETPVYIPYSNGQWIKTDAGWYFKAPTSAEELVSHYGRWVNSRAAGWLWVPGRVWAPAWVDWKQNESHVSWAPLPPTAYLNNGSLIVSQIDDENYVIVERKYFLEPVVYKYINPFYNNGSRILASELTRTDGLMVVNERLINVGPDVNTIQYIYGRKIDLVNIKYVKNSSDTRYDDSEYYVYTPAFKRLKSNGNKKYSVNEPRSFKKYNELKIARLDVKEYGKDNTGSLKEEKKINKEIKHNDHIQSIKKNIKKNYDNNDNNEQKIINKEDKNIKNKNIK